MIGFVYSCYWRSYFRDRAGGVFILILILESVRPVAFMRQPWCIPFKGSANMPSKQPATNWSSLPSLQREFVTKVKLPPPRPSYPGPLQRVWLVKKVSTFTSLSHSYRFLIHHSLSFVCSFEPHLLIYSPELHTNSTYVLRGLHKTYFCLRLLKWAIILGSLGKFSTWNL